MLTMMAATDMTAKNPIKMLATQMRLSHITLPQSVNMLWDKRGNGEDED